MTWHPVCRLGRILPDTGVAARIDGRPVAVFHLRDGRVLAVDHIDPFTGAAVLARGLLGDHDGVPTVASPLHKQRFSLLDGSCLDDPDVRVATHPTRLVAGLVQVAVP
jgi:nitrite reductase (NADH) small subunit